MPKKGVSHKIKVIYFIAIVSFLESLISIGFNNIYAK